MTVAKRTIWIDGYSPEAVDKQCAALTEALKSATTIEECKATHERLGLGYLAWHENAGIRHRKNERQARCRECGLWKFAHERCGIFK